MIVTSQKDMASAAMLMRIDDVLDRHAPEVFLRELARQFAERYLAEHYQEIVALVDQKAIATLSVAEAAAAVRETLEKKIPDKIVEVVKTKTEVYQRGILGGVRRIL